LQEHKAGLLRTQQQSSCSDALVPEGAIIDKQGKPSRDPEAYFDGGAILAKGGAMGYGLALIAELICEAMLGPVLAISRNTSKAKA